MSNTGKIYIVDLEISLKESEFIFGSINISHIPYDKLEELFKDQVNNEKFLFDNSMGYAIDEKLYKKNKEFFNKEIDFTFDFDLFEYFVRLYGNDIGSLKNYYHLELPPLFKL